MVYKLYYKFSQTILCLNSVSVNIQRNNCPQSGFKAEEREEHDESQSKVKLTYSGIEIGKFKLVAPEKILIKKCLYV